MQPLVSATKFYGTMPAMPYKMMVERPRRCSYGSAQLYGHYPLQVDAGLLEAGIITGMIFVIP